MATSATPKLTIPGGSFLLESRRPEEVFTPEDFSDQHRLIAQTAEEFAQNEIIPNIEKMEHKDFSVTRDLLKKAGELGLSGVEIPEAYGGLEMDKVTAAVIADRIAKYAGFATTWGGHTGIGTLPIVYSPTPALPTCSRFSPKWMVRNSQRFWSSGPFLDFQSARKNTRWASAGHRLAPSF